MKKKNPKVGCCYLAGVKKKKEKQRVGDDADGEEDGKWWGKNVGSEMVGGLWLSGSGKGKSKDPGE